MSHRRDRIRVLFAQFADAPNLNAQSLNAREIARRLDPKRFKATLFHTGSPDPRLHSLSHVTLRRIPARLGSASMLAESLQGHDILFSPPSGLRFTELFFRLPTPLRRRQIVVRWIEGVLKGNFQDLDARAVAQYRRQSERIDVHVAITDHVAETSLRDFGIRSDTVIPVGVDSEIFAPAMRDHHRPPTVLFVGHLVERKGPDLVVAVARVLPDVRFRLIGATRGEFGENLKSTVVREELSNVEFIDPLPQRSLADLMGRCDLLLHPSRVEGMPKVVLEGAATGLPAVIFSDYQAPVVVDGTTGFVIDDFDGMVRRLRQLIENPGLRHRMGQAAIEHARRYDWDIVGRTWEELFLTIARRRSARRSNASSRSDLTGA